MRTDVLVVGSGAGGAVTAVTLAEGGRDVLVLEEGRRFTARDYGAAPTEAMARMFRARGMNPIMGSVPVAYAEGCCVGGSTEINSGFWSRPPGELLAHWKYEFNIADASESDLLEHYAWAEQALGVGTSRRPWPASTAVFDRGLRAMGWKGDETPRAAPGCANTNTCAQGCPTGAKQGMSVKLLPRAEAAGARVLPGYRVERLLRDGTRVRGVRARVLDGDAAGRRVDVEAAHVFVCGGPTETPALLRRSGIRHAIGNTLGIHPYLKVVARFPEIVDADKSVMPLLQVKEFTPDITMGGAYFTPGHLAVMLNENPTGDLRQREERRRMAAYYVGVRGTGRGSVRPSWVGDGLPRIHYWMSREDIRNLSRGFAQICRLLLAAGAEVVHAATFGVSPVRSEAEARTWLERDLPWADLALQTVHVFSSCPIGERPDRCAADSFGRVRDLRGLSINDASMLPDSPGVNPQATIMAMARRNAQAFLGRPAGMTVVP
jgi:choline dehydrogenase-like flavoprotein